MASRRLIAMVAFLLTCITYTVYGEEGLETDETAKRRPPPRIVLQKEDKRRPPPKSAYYQASEKQLADVPAGREQQQRHLSPFTGIEEPMEKRRPPPKSLYKVGEESKRRPPPRYLLADIESRYPVKRRPPPQFLYRDVDDVDKRRPPPRSVFLRSGLYSNRPLEELVSGSAEDEKIDSRPPTWVYADQSRRRTAPSRASSSLTPYYTPVSDGTEDNEFRPPPWVYADRTKRRMPPPWILQQARMLEAEIEREEANRNKYQADDSDWETAEDQNEFRPPAWVYAGRARMNKGDKTKMLEQYDENKWRLVPDYYGRDQGMVRSAKSCVPSGEYCTSCDCNCCSRLCLWHPSAGLVYSKCVSPAICDPSFTAILASGSFECRKQY